MTNQIMNFIIIKSFYEQTSTETSNRFDVGISEFAAGEFSGQKLQLGVSRAFQ